MSWNRRVSEARINDPSEERTNDRSEEPIEQASEVRLNHRSEERINVCVPLRFRPVTNPPVGEQLAETENLSRRGLFFSTAVELQVDMQVELFLKMPGEISGTGAVDVRCVARVVHLQPDPASGKTGVGLQIERIEALATKDRWTS